MSGRRTMAEILIDEAPVWGIRLERNGTKLVISPASKCPPEFKELLREHKAEILDLLEARDDGLSPDCRPWLHVARQVINGEFGGADSSLREALVIGLRGIAHPICRDALKLLGAEKEAA